MFRAKHRKTIAITIMMLPGFLWLFILRYLPMGGIIMAFQDYRPHPPNPTLINNIINSRFVGLDNFEFIFATDRAFNMIRNTIGYNLVFIILTTVLSIALAIALNEITKPFLAKAWQTLMFFPFFISWVVASYFVFAFLAPHFGIFSDIRNWYHETEPWPFILTGANLWKNLGFNCIIYFAAIKGIDQEQYEAAAIDGASKWRQIWSITIPGIKPMIIILFIMAIGRIFNADFGLFWNVPNNMGPLMSVTEVFDTYVFRAMQTMSVGMSTAAGLFQSFVGFILIMAANTIVRKVDKENALI
ncbi:MAG: ABC transporter permease subunit [Oscillospiraceae bacterium]|nr:ABC transporter permease subunit [Oscillospiraceae bacterium]MCL2278404.1 ABC transporter permease subunit [Oscillospiraceae bacterium]